MARNLLAICLLIFLSVACAERRPSAPSGTDGKAISSSDSLLPGSVFPHSADWSSPASHGAWVVQYGLPACLECHEASSDKTSPPACSACHLYPHPVDWTKKENHGAKALEGRAACATQCHGADLQGGLSGISCNLCHTIYPHSAGWVGPDRHGKAAEGAARPACKACHGDDFKTVLDGKNCYSCHLTYPHDQFSPADWGTYEGHGQYALSSAKKLECQPCHGTDYTGGPRGNPSCFSCHAPYPHTQAGWLRPPGQPQEHGNYVVANTSVSCATARCHGVGMVPAPGTTNGDSCSGCHQAYPPHKEADWKDATGHPVYVKNTLLGSLTACKLCHGNDLLGGNAGRSCQTSCHPVPHELTAAWKETGHGQRAVDLPFRRDNCGFCHGADLLGGISGKSCKSCHTEFPHSATWVVKQTETVTTTGECCNPDDEADCWSCPVSTIADRMFLHGQKFMEQKAAGFPASPNRCSTCHGANYEGGNSLVSCISCHPGYPHIKYSSPNWRVDDLAATPLGGQHTTAFLGGSRDFTSPCADCHLNFGTGVGAIGLAGVAAKACNSCHVYYPHLKSPDVPASQDWVTGLRSSYHGYKFLLETFVEGPADPNICKTCHGNDLRGLGSAPKDCASCHDHFGMVSHEGCCRITDHPDAPWRQASHHGQVFLSSLADGGTFAGRCGRCHNSLLKRDPAVCNPYFPEGARDACTICHKTPGGGCP